MRKAKLVLLGLGLVLVSCSNSGGTGPTGGTPVAQWAETLTAGSNARFNAVAVDSLGNVYAAGYVIGTGTFGFGNGKTVTGAVAGQSVILVKYNSAGAAQWAQTMTTTSGTSAEFVGVAVDSSGNVYAVGSCDGAGLSYSFGGSASAAGTATTNVLLVKYDSSGVGQWARSFAGGTGNGGQYDRVAVDSSGIYAVGDIASDVTYGFNAVGGVTAKGSFTSSALVVKYDLTGAAQWAQTTVSGTAASLFSGVAVDSSGNVYAAGYMSTTASFTFGTQTVAGSSSAQNVLLVKYNSSGQAQWARANTAGSGNLQYAAVTVDSTGAIYAAGVASGSATSFGNNVSVPAPSVAASLLVKYDSSGNAQWAQTPTGSGQSDFVGIAAAGSAIYAAGEVGAGVSNYGNGVSTGGPAASNVLLVAYDANGHAQWAQTAVSATDVSWYYGVAASGSIVYGAGYMGTGTFIFGNGVGATGTASSGSSNVLLVKYQ